MNATLNAVTAFINTEADMLDFQEYEAWLNLWDEDGSYVVPIDTETEDYANSLNFAYDNATMRRLRVNRLISGEAVSTQTTPKTVRSPSRFRILDDADDVVTVRCAQLLSENRHGNLRTYPSDVTYKLRREGDGFRMVEKVVRLLNADHHLSSIGYIL
ncbi:aromatic-ring-hydroxylating dioxygenase subunit beta [Rhodospirillum sp. A1_3_36]|uniref:aromatic-ring-hydroxylating dioxygenase subunit beta n=1 Tax=Rhodospirillum sp. A1_3_36 TaxID=3391666 RepID=UPI0039A5D2B0